MAEKISYAPQNSIIFVSDSLGGEPPDHVTDDLVHYNETCVSVGCFPEIEGETELTVGKVEEVEPDFALAFDGVIATPSKKLTISTVLDEPLLQTQVQDIQTRIHIWVDHPRWPEKVVVGWG